MIIGALLAVLNAIHKRGFEKGYSYSIYERNLKVNKKFINPFTGQRSSDRIWSADGERSIRFGGHEMDSMGIKNFHYHRETWFDDYVLNELQRIQMR